MLILRAFWYSLEEYENVNFTCVLLLSREMRKTPAGIKSGANPSEFELQEHPGSFITSDMLFPTADKLQFLCAGDLVKSYFVRVF
jgi:hypothetical protein